MRQVEAEAKAEFMRLVQAGAGMKRLIAAGRAAGLTEPQVRAEVARRQQHPPIRTAAASVDEVIRS